MPTLDPKTLRFLALLSAPLFALLKGKLGIDLPESTQDLLIGTVALYILGSHSKEAIVKAAEAKGAVAAATIATVDHANAALKQAADAQVTP